jgi:hypothetical protein
MRGIDAPKPFKVTSNHRTPRRFARRGADIPGAVFHLGLVFVGQGYIHFGVWYWHQVTRKTTPASNAA